MSRRPAYFLVAALVAASGLAATGRALVAQPSPATPSRSRVALTRELPRLDPRPVVDHPPVRQLDRALLHREPGAAIEDRPPRACAPGFHRAAYAPARDAS